MFGSSFSRSFRAGERPVQTISDAQIASAASIWYDAATPTYFQPTNPINGDAITQWNDRSSAAHNAGPVGGANKPTYVFPGLNGYGVVNLSGTQNLEVSNTGWLAGQGAVSVFIVAKLNNNTVGARTLIHANQSSLVLQWSGSQWLVGAAGGQGVVTTPIADVGFHIFTLLYDGAQIGNAARLRFRCDSVEYMLSYGVTTVGSVTNAATSKFDVGWDGTSAYWLGQVAEVLVFTSAQNSTQVNSIENYLKKKWAL